jgi:hypothetical protein
MHTQLKKWIGQNKQQLEQLGHWKRIRRFVLDSTGEEITPRELYDLLYPTKVIDCSSATFIGYAVGYRSCSKNCPCYISRVSSAVKASKQAISDQEKSATLQRRRSTVAAKYGVENVAQTHQVKAQIAETKQLRYGHAGFNNSAQAKETNQSKYGVDNVMQVQTFAEKNQAAHDHDIAAARTAKTKKDKYGHAAYNNTAKAKQTNLTKYGVTNVSKIPEVQAKISSGLRSTFVERHAEKYNITPMFATSQYQPGKHNDWQCNQCQNTVSGLVLNGKFTRCRSCHPYGSGQENQVKEFVRSLGFDVIENSRSIISPLEIDIYIPEKKLAIEYCGTYWHSEQLGKGRQYHKNKLDQCNALDIRLVTLFSTHWVDSNHLVKSRLAQLLGVQQRKMFARKCTVDAVDTKTARDFLDQHHLQGYCNSSYRYGLWNGSELVAVMTFAKSRFEANKEELIRFATKQGVAVVGAASRLLKRHLQCSTASELVTYSDNTWGYSTFYQSIGFEPVNNGNPGYHYIDLKGQRPGLMNRMQFQKHKLSKLGLLIDYSASEYNNMLANGYDRVWDCGHSKYRMQLAPGRSVDKL